MAKAQSLARDSRHGAIIQATIDSEHYHVHKGKAFKAKTGNISLALAGTEIIAFKTPNADEKVHVVVLSDTSGLGTVEIMEAPTVTIDSGTAVEWKNRNRGSVITSEMLSLEAVPQVGFFNLNPTLTVDGDILDTNYTGVGNNRQSGQSRDMLEWELKKDTVYAVRLTSGGAANVVNLALLAYETEDYF